MNFDDIPQTEQSIIGKQQLLVKMQLADRNGSAIDRQQLAVKASLAREKASSQGNALA